MASKLLWVLQFSVISLSFATNWKEKICTKEFLQKNTKYKFDKLTYRVIPEEKIERRISFVCCEGYRETSRNKELPNCSPICKKPCGYGYCYTPNQCACYHGFELSGGICQRRREIVRTSTPPFDTRFEATTMLIDNKPFSTITIESFQRTNLRTTNPTQDLKTTHSTSTTNHHKDLEVVSSIEKTNLKNSSIDVTDFPRVQFITHNKDSNLEPMSPTSLEDEQAQKPLPKDVTDYQRVKFIPNENSGLQNSHPKRSNFRDNTESDRNIVKIPKPFDFEKLAFCIMNICICEFGYEAYQQKYCYPCQMGSQCQCQSGYAFNSWTFQCKPLCNGAFDGCVRGTCIEYNQCKCDNGTEKINGDNFRCYVKEGQLIIPNLYNIDKRWYLVLLSIPAVILVACFCIIIKRSRSSAANRLRAQKHVFPEIRYFDTSNNLRVDTKHQEAAGRIHNEIGLGENESQNHGKVLVITV